MQRASKQFGAEVVFADVCMVTDDGLELNRHDPAKLASVLDSMYSEWVAAQAPQGTPAQ